MCIIFTAGSLRSARNPLTLNFNITTIIKFFLRIITSVIFIIVRSKHIVSILIVPTVEPRVPIFMAVSLWCVLCNADVGCGRIVVLVMAAL